jgi:SAM-dependent methyltransferase
VCQPGQVHGFAEAVSITNSLALESKACVVLCSIHLGRPVFAQSRSFICWKAQAKGYIGSQEQDHGRHNIVKPKDYYSRIEDRTYDWMTADLGADFAPFREQILPLVGQLPTGGRVLDIGCQAGHMLHLIRPRFDEAHGIDIGDYSEYWQRWPDMEFSIHDVDADPLPFETDSMSLILCNNVFEHVFDVFGLASEIGRVLHPNGYCVIMVPNAGYFRHVLSLIRGRVPRTGSQTYPFREGDGWDGCHLHYFTLSEFTWLLNKHGIRTLSVHSSGKYLRVRRLWPSLLFADLVLLGQCQ